MNTIVEKKNQKTKVRSIGSASVSERTPSLLALLLFVNDATPVCEKYYWMEFFKNILFANRCG